MTDRRGRWLLGSMAMVGALGFAGFGYAYAVEPRRLQSVWFRLTVPGLPPALEGVRVAHLTDFHAGMVGTRRATLRRAVALARSWRPDIVALTGDFVDAGVWEPELNLVKDLASAAPTFAVLGNHDRESTAAATARVVAALGAQGVTVLGNAHRVVPVRDDAGTVVVVAVDDSSTGRDDVGAALAGLPAGPERDRPAILLAHSPEIADRVPPARFALILTGHTHGGQIHFSPFKRRTPLDVGMVAGGLDAPYARGVHLVRGNPLFVNNGLGVSGVPFRFLAPPQVACFVLSRSTRDGSDGDDVGPILTPIDAP